MMFGGGGGGWGGSPQQWQAGQGPFAGIPPELQERASKLLATEKEAPDPDLPFSHQVPPTERAPFTLRRFLAPQWPGLVLLLGLVYAEVFLMQVSPDLIRRGVDRGVIPHDFGVLRSTALLMAAAVSGAAMITWVRTMAAGRIGEGLLYRLRIRIFSQLQRLSMSFYERELAGRVMTHMTSDVEKLQMLFQQGLVQMLVAVVMLEEVCRRMLGYDVQLALTLIVIEVPLILAATMWFRSASDKAFLDVRDRIADVLADLQESLSGIRIVTMYNRQRHNTINHRNVVGRHFDANKRAGLVQARYGPGIESLGLAGTALILFVAHGLVGNGTLTPGQLLAFYLYQNMLFAPIQQLVQLYSTYQDGRQAIVKIRGLLAEPIEVVEAPDAHELPPIRGELVLDDVTFSYVPGHPVMRDVSLRIAAGETFALVGPTGAGKSTIAKLITRFYDPQQGSVSVDGHNLRKVTLDSLRRQLGVVPQEAYLFGGSIRDNIRFARPNASDDEVMAACRAVGMDDLIERLPFGLDTPCHERGVTLSSGERQLLALARAFMAEPRVLILDEATSNLDLATEARIERALDVLLEGRTAVLIAHRLSTAMRANRIAVVEGGRIVELGSHDELVALGGRYARMFATWVEHGGGVRAATGNGDGAGTSSQASAGTLK